MMIMIMISSGLLHECERWLCKMEGRQADRSSAMLLPDITARPAPPHTHTTTTKYDQSRCLADHHSSSSRTNRKSVVVRRGPPKTKKERTEDAANTDPKIFGIAETIRISKGPHLLDDVLKQTPLYTPYCDGIRILTKTSGLRTVSQSVFVSTRGRCPQTPLCTRVRAMASESEPKHLALKRSRSQCSCQLGAAVHKLRFAPACVRWHPNLNQDSWSSNGLSVSLFVTTRGRCRHS
jgi:hypothetical protein